tara:strand:- start:546 stop:698 length:153 start_codon:yes stop_codon:yes gene_type:complete
MKNYVKNINTYWAFPLLGILTAHHWFLGNISSGNWWYMIVIFTLLGYWKR